MSRRPNIVFVFADEWRAQATGYGGDPNCQTPVLDTLASESLNLDTAVSGCPVSCPYRAGLMTGQYPLTHGVFINDVELDPNCHSIAHVFKNAGYKTGYIGKWHLYGSPQGRGERRKQRVPRAYQLGFDLWMGCECCHDYWHSPYYVNDDPTARQWEGYDAFAQSRAAAKFIDEHHGREEPYLLMLSWGPPHFPLETAPPAYRQRLADRPIQLRPNVPSADREKAEAELRGYYAHIEALDDAMGIVLDAVDRSDPDNTIVVFTSDHGDMSWSQGLPHKWYPFDESIRVPFLLRAPSLSVGRGDRLSIPIDAPDIMPTLLGLCDLAIPAGVQGRDWSAHLRGEQQPDADDAALLMAAASTTWMQHYKLLPYRGLRTVDYTYVRTTDGPWLLYDNRDDPYQMNNLIGREEYQLLQRRLDEQLMQRLAGMGDQFLNGEQYLQEAGLAHYKEANWPAATRWVDPWS